MQHKKIAGRGHALDDITIELVREHPTAKARGTSEEASARNKLTELTVRTDRWPELQP